MLKPLKHLKGNTVPELSGVVAKSFLPFFNHVNYSEAQSSQILPLSDVTTNWRQDFKFKAPSLKVIPYWIDERKRSHHVTL